MNPQLSIVFLFGLKLFMSMLLFGEANQFNLMTQENHQLNYTFLSLRKPVTNFKDLIALFQLNNPNPVAFLTTVQAIRNYGYPVEEHQVFTDDGYVLTMHRIPGGKNESGNHNDANYSESYSKPVVYLQHGLFASSYEWMMNQPEKLLALQLADAGYDVWLGNCRGNAYSRKHTRFTVNDRRFWEFSFDEMGKYDLPAEIDYIIGKTNQQKIYYIGFSMGTTMFWVMTSSRPEYNEKVHGMIALAPVLYINNMKGFPKLLAPFGKFIKIILDVIGNGEFLPPWLLTWYNRGWTRICSNQLLAESICANVNFLYAGWDLPQAQINQLPLFYKHTPSPTSTRTLAHIAQLINSGNFMPYNYGFWQNLQVYGRPYPKLYDISRTTCPTALIWGRNDAVVEPKDVERAMKNLRNVVYNKPVEFPLWNHFDYHLGRDVNQLVNENVMKLLKKF